MFKKTLIIWLQDSLQVFWLLLVKISKSFRTSTLFTFGWSKKLVTVPSRPNVILPFRLINITCLSGCEYWLLLSRFGMSVCSFPCYYLSVCVYLYIWYYIYISRYFIYVYRIIILIYTYKECLQQLYFLL